MSAYFEFAPNLSIRFANIARDIAAQLDCKGKPLLVPHTMLCENDVVFLDGMNTSDLSSKLGVPVFKVTADDGYDFIGDITEIIESMKG